MTNFIKTPEEVKKSAYERKYLEILKCSPSCIYYNEENSLRNYSICTKFPEPKIIEESENLFPSFCPLKSNKDTFTLKQIHDAYEKVFSSVVGADYWNNYWKMVEHLLND